MLIKTDGYPFERIPAPLLSWYDREKRDLAWRKNADPYRVWVSEIMLQQTRVEAVKEYYDRFLRELPTVEHLASVDEDKLLKLWEGLGYYSRARNLQKAAKLVVERGGFPSEPTELKKLPGIGDYTAGAIASIAFGEPAPAVDGNVLRVMTRVLGDESDIALPETKKKIAALLEEIYPTGSAAGDLTEGIMELGERVCIPAGVPLCTVCPLKEICKAKDGLWKTIPVKSPKKERRILNKTVFVLKAGERIAIRRRPEDGLLAGMWEFYSTDVPLAAEETKAYLEAEGFSPEKVIPLGKAKHVFTHLEWHMTGFLVECTEETEGFVWKTFEEIDSSYAIPTALQKIKQKAKEKAN